MLLVKISQDRLRNVQGAAALLGECSALRVEQGIVLPAPQLVVGVQQGCLVGLLNFSLLDLCKVTGKVGYTSGKASCIGRCCKGARRTDNLRAHAALIAWNSSSHYCPRL
ncbi:hypothetical protein D3C77_474460 [compost metagenome]